MLITGTGSLVKTGAWHRDHVTNTDDYSTSTTISAGAIQLGSSGTIGSLASDVVDNGALVISRTNAITLTNSISGIGSLTNTGTGATTLSGSNTLHRRDHTASSGTIRLGSAGRALSHRNTAHDPKRCGSSDLNGNNAVVSSVSGVPGQLLLAVATVLLRSATAASVSAVISGAGTLAKDGAGDVTLTAVQHLHRAHDGRQQDARFLPADNPASPSFAASSTGILRIDHTTFNLGSRSIQASATTAGVEYNFAVINGGFLRGPGTHTILPGTSSTFSGVTTFNSTNIQQSGTLLLRNVTSGGKVTNNAALTWDGGINNSSGVFTVNNIANVDDWTNQGVTTINSGGVLNNSVSDAVSGGGKITINSGGTLNTDTDGSGSGVNLMNSLLVNNGVHQWPGLRELWRDDARDCDGQFNGAVVINDGGVFHADAKPSPAVLPAVVLIDSAELDVSSSLIIDYTGASPAAGIRGYIAASFDNGLWDKPGIMSSLAEDPDSGYRTAVGYGDNTDLGITTFGGRTVDPSSVLLKYTWYGDNNLDGKVDSAADFGMFLDGLTSSGSGELDRRGLHLRRQSRSGQ